MITGRRCIVRKLSLIRVSHLVLLLRCHEPDKLGVRAYCICFRPDLLTQSNNSTLSISFFRFLSVLNFRFTASSVIDLVLSVIRQLKSVKASECHLRSNVEGS